MLCKDFHNEEKVENNKSKSEFIFASFLINVLTRHYQQNKLI